MKTSIVTTSFSRRTLVQILLMCILLAVIITGFVWYVGKLGRPATVYELSSLAALTLLFGLLQWRRQRSLLARLVDAAPVRKTEPSGDRKRAAEADRDLAAEQARRASREKRIFVHLFSVLQREGRLMDFLQEDLSLYEDGQIGAAVRSIHENCRKTLGHYLTSEPVMPQNEGETVNIDPDFDPAAIKLVGNVVGEPPFSGIVRHRGWKLRSLSMPELGDVENPDIIAPAEVEVQ